VNVLDLFSGVGGFSLGLEWAGCHTVALCENDDFCRGILGRRFPGVPLHRDIRELDGRQYRGAAQLVCGGFPCQPYSVAGIQSGADDDRALWPEMFRIIREVQPVAVIAENVPGIVNLEFDKVLSDLEGENFACQSFDIPAAGIDAHHIRHRIWFIAYSRSQRVWQQSGWRIGQGGAEAARAVTDRQDDPHAHGGRCEEQWQQEHGNQRSERRGEPHGLRAGGWWERQGRWFAGEPAIWPAEPGVGRISNGVPNRVDRLRALGNSVAPGLVEVIGRHLLEDLITRSHSGEGIDLP